MGKEASGAEGIPAPDPAAMRRPIRLVVRRGNRPLVSSLIKGHARTVVAASSNTLLVPRVRPKLESRYRIKQTESLAQPSRESPVTFWTPTTGTGVRRVVKVPSPTWLSELPPQP